MNNWYLLGLTVLLGLGACNNNLNNEQAALLEGQWLFEDGQINQQQQGIELLKNLKFEFKDQQISCELLPEMNPAFNATESYILKDGIIEIREKLQMRLKSIDQDSMMLEFTLSLGGEESSYSLLFKRL